MKIQIVSQGSTKIDRLTKKWGLAILINNDILFDTFCNGDLLARDLRKLSIDIQAIRHIVISHEHWDHTGGLWYILRNNRNVSVHVCSHFSQDFRKKVLEHGCRLHEVTKTVQITDNIHSTGELKGSYGNYTIFEQSLIIKEKETIAVVTGCSHPGILRILSHIHAIHPEKIKLLTGGLHMMNQSVSEIRETAAAIDSLYGIDTIAPFHCTGMKTIKEFEGYMLNIRRIKTGDSFIFDNTTSRWEFTGKTR